MQAWRIALLSLLKLSGEDLRHRSDRTGARSVRWFLDEVMGKAPYVCHWLGDGFLVSVVRGHRLIPKAHTQTVICVGNGIVLSRDRAIYS